MTDRIDIVARDRRDTLGEGTLWVPGEQALYWVDILGKRLSRLVLATRAVTEWALPEMTGWVIERTRGGFVAGAQSGVKALTLDPFAIVPLVDLTGEPETNRMNDAKADSAGRIWAGTMPVACDVPTGSLYRLDTNHVLTRVDDGYVVTNGPAIDPGGQWMFHTDTVLGRIYRFAIRDDGTLDDRTTFVEFQEGWGKPDGMTLDADGGLWVAHWGGSRVTRFDPDGKVERDIRLPASQITNIAFGGEAFDRMFVTSAADGVDEEHGGALFEIDPGCRGLAAQKYAG